jgi:S1/P1 Nuclease
MTQEKKLALILFCAWALTKSVNAYGPDGHEIVGGIADKRLANTPTAAKIAALTEGIPLARAANMPDEIKSWDRNGAGDLNAYPHYSQKRIEEQLRTFWTANQPTDDHNSAVPSHHWFHYTDVPVLNLEKYADGKTGRSQWDIVHMMRFCVQVLKGETPENNPRKITKPVALILLAHYVGDIHQPLHVGAEYFDANGKKTDPDRGKPGLEDQGGNSIVLELPSGGGYGGKKGKLHSYWDSDPVFALFPSTPRDLKGKERSEAIKAPRQQLIEQLAREEPKNWRTPASVPVENYGEAWANDILPEAREAHERLRFVNIHRKPEVNSDVAEGTAMEQPMPDHISYRDWSARVVRDELHKAGWRLADMLEKIFSGTSPVVAATPVATPAVQPAATPVIATSPVATLTPKSAIPEPSIPTDPVYGDYPIKYKALIMDWLYQHLYDPLSARIEWQGEPKRGDLPDARGRKIYGYLVLFSVNSRNRFGSYTGKQTHGALIRNGDVVQISGFVYEKR